jgi:hypothetical protein
MSMNAPVHPVSDPMERVHATGDRRFVIASLPRSGSTTLARALNCHPGIRCLIEPFHPRRYQGTFRRMAMEGDVTDALERIWTRWNGIKHVWESSGWPFLGRPELNDRLLSESGLKVVFLVRRNWLRRLVSNLICRQTQFWIGTREEFCSRLEYVRLRPLDPTAVLTQIRADQEAVNRCLASLSNARVKVLQLQYEDVFRDGSGREERLALLNTVLGFLGFPRVADSDFGEAWERHFDPVLNRWASPEIYRRIPGIARLDEEAGSEETGWLFKGH